MMLLLLLMLPAFKHTNVTHTLHRLQTLATGTVVEVMVSRKGAGSADHAVMSEVVSKVSKWEAYIKA